MAQLGDIDTALIGHGVNREMARCWPTASGAYADLVNAMAKVVFVGTAEPLEWQNSNVVPVSADADLLSAVTRLKDRPGRDMVLFGGARLARSFARLRLIDEFRLCVHPVALGAGIALFGRLDAPQALEPIATRRFPSGAALRTCRPTT